MPKTAFRQGDIVLIPYPYDDLSSAKKRPVVLISKDEINIDSFIVAKITSVARDDYFSFHLADPDLTIALPKPSEVRTNQLFTAHKSLIIKKFSHLKQTALVHLTEQIKANITVP